MNDVIVVRHLLAAHAGLLALVPATNIMAGTIPEGMRPAVSIRHISAVWAPEVSKQSTFCRARVQVEVVASDYSEQAEIIQQVRAAVPRRPGVVAGVNVDSILRLADGPDLSDDTAGIYMQIQDFMVAFTE